MWRRSGTALSQRLALSEEVSEALYGRVKKPVVALESTIISHGMPFPQNLEMAKHVEEIVRSHGACPATVCIADGSLKVGLAEQDLTQLVELGAGAKKCSTRDIAAAVTDKKVVGATTVSSTMRIAHAAGIKVFVTGGIGGVHRFCEETMVIGYKTDQFPAFFTQDSGEKAHLRRDTSQDIARLILESEALELPNGHIIAVPNPEPVPSELINEAIELGLKEVADKNIHGQAVTPYLLKRVNEITQGVSLTSNIDLVNNNATVGSQPTPLLIIPCLISTSSGNRVLVVGGLVLDIISSSTSPLIRGTSNIGTIKQSSGGVGRNIAECLHRLRLDPLLVSSIGSDASGSILLENLKKLGMNTSGIRISDNLSTAVYSAVLDSTGDMDAAVADMSAFESIESKVISDKAIDKAKLVIADGNLIPATIGDLFTRCVHLGVDTWFEPTSVQKAIRVVEGGGVSSMKYMSPNADELHAISNAIRQETELSAENNAAHERFPLTKESGIIPQEEMERLKNDLITTLLAMADGDTKRPKHVMVTLGKNGVLVASINMAADNLREIVDDCDFDVEIWGMHHVHGGHSVTMVHLPGDSLVGGTVYGLLEGYDILQSCHMGMIAARKSLASEHAISPELAPQILYSEP
ncbi:hypothetical protein AM588_10006327 [Phytophthora nicotianae]|uniref:Carbohydrate kinase PfkB domain-containing protein n=1 Tax=Phytophthora nicotianae TaxID=4792 RepID=A0A0W8DKN7_PHYNI|nr:hypothetical protein AM588_10006327 [Phytophthora nicotianae]